MLFEGIAGSVVELPCDPPEGNPEPAVRWRHNGKMFDFAAHRYNRLVLHFPGVG